jgi:hypothetical protein
MCIGTPYAGGTSYTILGDMLCTAIWTEIPVVTTTTTTEPPATTTTTEPPATTTEPVAAITEPPPVPAPTPGDAPIVIDGDSAIDNSAQLAVVNELLTSESATSAEVAAAVGNLLAVGVTAQQATELATNPKVLGSIDSKQAQKVFKEIAVGKLSADQEAKLVAAVTDAPENVKNAFEGTIDVYASGLDAYVPVGSSIPVSERRTVIAAAAGATAAAGAASGIGSRGSSAGGSGSGSGSGGSGSGSGGSGSGSGSGGGPLSVDPSGEETRTSRPRRLMRGLRNR